jgi:hypothetical protein
MGQKAHVNKIGAHSIFDMLMVIVGIMLAFNWMQLPSLNLFYSMVLAFAGIIFVAVPVRTVRHASMFAALLGVYLVFRNMGLIDVAYLQYGLAIILIVVGVVNLVRDFYAGKTPPATENIAE